MYKLSTSCKDFKELEKGIFKIAQRICVQMLVAGLRQLDIKLMEERDKSRLRYINKKTRTMVTPFGEVLIERRCCRELVWVPYEHDRCAGLPTEC